MKKIIILTLIISGAFQASAQDAIEKFFSKYEDDDDFTQVVVTQRMFGLFADLDLDDAEDRELAEAIGGLKSLKILTKDETSEGKSLFKEANKLVDKGQYEVLMTITGSDENLTFYIKERNKLIEELLLIMGGDDEFFIMDLVGEIDLKQVSRLANAMDIDGLENLEKLDDN